VAAPLLSYTLYRWTSDRVASTRPSVGENNCINGGTGLSCPTTILDIFSVHTS